MKEARNILIRCGVDYQKDLFYFEPYTADPEDEYDSEDEEDRVAFENLWPDRY